MKKYIDIIIKDVIDKIKTSIISIYGIGSYFNSDFSHKKKTNIDIVVILEKIPNSIMKKRCYTKKKFDDGKVAIIVYSTLEMYHNPKLFVKHSFGDYSWSIHSLKEASKLLYGNDIRDNLPNPQYNYGQIFLRSAYHIDKVLDKKSQYYTRFTKSIFKMGFFLALIYNESNIYNYDIYNQNQCYERIKEMEKNGKVTSDFVHLYHIALENRMNDKTINDKFKFVKLIRFSMKTIIREVLNHTNYKKEDLVKILSQGFDGSGFNRFLVFLQNFY